MLNITKYYRKLEMWVSRFKVIEMVPFESLGRVSDSPSKVIMAVSLVIPEVLSVKEWPDLEIWFGVVQSHWKWRGSIEHVRLSIAPPL